MHISLDQALGRQSRLNRVGQSLLNIGEDAAAAYSLRSLNGGDPKVVNVRRSADDEEREFTASGVNAELENWVNGKLETTLPADIPPNPQDITGFTVSGTDLEFNSTFGFFGQQQNGKNKYVHATESNRIIRYGFNGKWEFSDDGDIYQISVDTNKDYPWEVEEWEQGPDGSGGDPVFSNFVGGTIDNTPAVAYSLRKVREAYTGDAVKIRRESDDAEADVAFDDNDEVSTSSAITVTSGSSTAATLGEFIDSEKTGRINFASGSNNWLSYDDSSSIFSNSLYGNGTIRSAYNHITDLDGIGASPVSDSDYSFKVDSVTGTSGHAVTIGANSRDYSYTFTFKYYVPVGQPDIQSVYGSVSSGSLSVKGQWEEVTVSSDASHGHRDVLIRSAAHASTGGIWYLADLNLEISSYNTSVVTWYDQSGNSNDATQDVAGNQPLIAEGGTYLGELDFDGTDDALETNNSDLCNLSELSLFTVLTPFRGALQQAAVSAGSTVSGSTGYGGWALNFNGYINKAGLKTQSQGNTSVTGASQNVPASESLVTSILNVPNATTSVNGVEGTASTNMIEPFNNNAARRKLRIGCQFTFQLANHYSKPIKEVILYDSDQSNNRFKIESNINNHYGIYTAAEDGFVETWFDQSGNGNDATQGALAGQPKIVSNGSLLNDIDFAGDTFLQATSLQEQVPVSFFCVNRFDSTLSGFRPFLGNGILDSSSTGYGMFYHDPSNTFRTQVRIPSASSNVDNTATTVGDVKALTTSFITASTLTSFYNGGNESSSANAQGAVTPNRTLTIGGSETGVTPTVTRFFNGGISEVVLYSTDQSSNRPAIESNMADEYGITLS